jgi:hypothetical protein
MYVADKEIEEFEKDYEYKSDEESIYGSFIHDVKLMPIPVTRTFSINSESSKSAKIFKDMIKRFTEKT